MGIKLSEVEEGSPIVLHLSKDGREMDMNASIKKRVREDLSIIELDYNASKRLSFEGVNIDMEFDYEGTMPIIWKNVRVVFYKSEYVLQASGEGVRNNRRGCFRVGISVYAKFRKSGQGAKRVLIRDISLSGFAITDNAKELGLEVGEEVRVSFEDINHNIELVGKVVRIEEQENRTIYGLEICNLCKELSSYVNMKQRQKR